MKHQCHAVGCTRVVHPRLLMCRDHWFMVPKAIRDRIWTLYRPGQEQTKNPSLEYMVVFYQAVGAVARREGKTLAAAECAKKQDEYAAKIFQRIP